MPYEIEMENAPAGYAGTSAKADELVQLIYREFTSTEDGQHFIKRLEGGVNPILERLPIQVPPSSVDHLLAIHKRDGKTTVYVNELEIQGTVRSTGSIRAGQGVTKDDIADIVSLNLGIDIPEDAGFTFVFSAGWRKGLFFDYGPILPNSEPRLYEVSSILAQAYAHVLFQELFSITEDEWNHLLRGKWFPFAGLSHQTIDSLISYARSGWDLDEKLDDIVVEVKGRAPDMLEGWRNNSYFPSHIGILERAVERYLDDDPVSCTGLLFPRIEGIMRSHHASISTTRRPTQANLPISAVSANVQNEKSLLLPRRFQQYLSEVYFAGFDPDDADIEVSRHSVGHGVASTSGFNIKNATISILIIHQLFYFLRSDQVQATTQRESIGTG